MKKLHAYIACHGASLGTIPCDIEGCTIVRHPAVLFNENCECEIGIMFKDFEQIEAFARSILFNLAERKVKSEI